MICSLKPDNDVQNIIKCLWARRIGVNAAVEAMNEPEWGATTVERRRGHLSSDR